MATYSTPLPYDLAADKSARDRLARHVLLAATLLGVAGDALLYEAEPGVNFLLLALLGAVVLRWLDRERGDGAHAHRALLLVPIVFSGAAIAWRANGMLVFFAMMFAAAGASLYAQALRTGPEWSLWRLDPVAPVKAGLAVARDAASQAAPLLLRDLPAGSLGEGRLTRAGAGWRGLLMALPLLLVLNGLLMSADAVWSTSIASLVDIDLQWLLGNAVVFGVLAWGSAGWLRGALLRQPERVEARTSSARALGDADVLLPMTLVNVLFGAFLAMQVRTLVGGAAYVKAVAGMTFAEYARSGFFQLVTVAALMLPALLVADALTPLDHRARRGFRRRATLTLTLLAGILASAAMRMGLYTAEFGLTEDRLFASAIMAWLTFVLGWFGATVLRGRRERFTGVALAGAWATWAALVVANPEAVIVRHNLARAAHGARYDATQALGLTSDAVPALVAALPRLDARDRCVTEHAVAVRAGAVRTWRDWTLSHALARRATAGRGYAWSGPDPWTAEACGPAAAAGR